MSDRERQLEAQSKGLLKSLAPAEMTADVNVECQECLGDHDIDAECDEEMEAEYLQP